MFRLIIIIDIYLKTIDYWEKIIVQSKYKHVNEIMTNIFIIIIS